MGGGVGVYPGVGAYPGYYGNCTTSLIERVLVIVLPEDLVETKGRFILPYVMS